MVSDLPSVPQATGYAKLIFFSSASATLNYFISIYDFFLVLDYWFDIFKHYIIILQNF
jgi:hypothetical protein